MKVSGKTHPIELASELNFLEHLPRDFPSASLQFGYKNFSPQPHKQHKDKSWLDLMYPFEFESDHEDDYGDYKGSTEQKFLKLHKFKKLKKIKKKKKKIVLMKILLGILVFIAVKVLLPKFAYYISTFVGTVGRDELYHDGEHELDRGGGDVKLTSSSNFAALSTRGGWNNLEHAEHRSVPNYDEVKIDVKIPEFYKNKFKF